MANQQNSTNINWYPGHMAKTKRQIQEDLKLIDVVVEILDARIPMSSRNPDIEELIKNKDRLIVLNKYDLADEKQNQKWIQYFKNNGLQAVLVNSNTGEGINQAVKKIEEIYEATQEKFENKGRVGKAIRVMILGIPNVGKSSFINRLTKKNSTVVGNKPGVTRQKQWIRINGNIELLDTPGVLWPKFESEEVALNLAYTGTIKDDILQTIEVGFSLLKLLVYKYLELLTERYKLDKRDVENILNLEDLEENERILEIMHLIGKKRGALISGGNIDEEKTARMLLDEFKELFEIKRTPEEVNLLSPLTWAYVGDAVYELYIRMHLVNNTKLKPHKLHIEAIKYVKAKAQAETLKKIENDLTEKEKEIVKRGRNAENHHLPKNATVQEYMHSTGFEALIGYLYLTKQDERLRKILDKCVE